MQRRTLLELAAGAGALGSSSLGGCLGLGSDPADCETEHRWCYGVGGRLDAVDDGTLYARTRRAGQSGQDPPYVVALDAESGARQWAYSTTSSSNDTYSELAIGDGVYFSHCTDDPCVALIALDRDGEERWTRDIDAGWRGPVLADGAVYVDGAPVRALDAASGETRWTYPRQSDEGGSVLEVADDAYVHSGTAVAALDPADGSERWRYDLGDVTELDTSVVDGVVHVLTFDGVTAVSDGERSWQWTVDDVDVDAGTEFVGVAADHLFVRSRDQRREYRLHALDLATGEQTWVSDPVAPPGMEESEPEAAVRGDAVYVGAERLRALDAATGDERWSRAVDGGAVTSVSAVDASGAGDHAVFVGVGRDGLASFTPAGERTWEASVDGDVWNVLVDEHVYVATDEAIYALDSPGGP